MLQRGQHGGYVTIVDPDRPTQEYDTITCAHCGKSIFVRPNTAFTRYLISKVLPTGLIVWEETDGAGCYRCGYKPVCLRCHGLGTCTPVERWLEEQEGTVRPDQVTFGGFS